ncbi:hypothetical protein [Fontivita pretiosa]|uniref:hypothetical protein n=1 Tax=Fontivita pretiosa TaxID=2989684 RepID=UPI003D1757A2
MRGNRLVQYKDGATLLATYEYDALYRRIEETSGHSEGSGVFLEAARTAASTATGR